eukprot:PRCOL_00001882-RA
MAQPYGGPPPGGYGGQMGRGPAMQGGGRPGGRPLTNVEKITHPSGLSSDLLVMFEPPPPLVHAALPRKRQGRPLPPYTGASRAGAALRRAAPRRARARPAAALTRALPLARAVGIAAYTKEFETTPAPARPPAQPLETKASRKQKQRDVKALAHAAELKELSKAWDPTNDPKLEGDPFKTLLVARLAYTVTESKLRREFEAFGPVRRVRIVVDPKTEQPRGYAFVEFFHSGDMKAAYKEADGMKMEGRRILVDVERARTVEGFKPRRLGGGLGDTRRDRAPGTKPVGPTIYKDTSSMADRGRQAASGGYGGGGYGSRGGGGVGYGDRDRYGGYSRSHSGYGGNDRTGTTAAGQTPVAAMIAAADTAASASVTRGMAAAAAMGGKTLRLAPRGVTRLRRGRRGDCNETHTLRSPLGPGAQAVARRRARRSHPSLAAIAPRRERRFGCPAAAFGFSIRCVTHGKPLPPNARADKRTALTPRPRQPPQREAARSPARYR